MSKLGKQPARLGHAPTRLAPTGQTQTQARYQATPWRAWYGLKIWEDLRRAAFLRDGYTCQLCGRLCTGRGQHPASPIGDHRTPHRGDWALFTDLGNVQTLCKRCHDSDKARIEAGRA